MKNVNFYRTESDNCPVENFLDSLSGKQAQRVVWVLQLIEELDTVPAKYFKKLINTDDIWEVRVQVGRNIFRLFGFLDGSDLILNHAFQKKTQKTPPKEISLAEKRKSEYFKRRKKS